MKTYHAFIASSLSFQKERGLIEKVLKERNSSELNIVVHRHEKDGNNDIASDDTQEIINSEIRQCDVVIFFAGNWIRSKTIGEFKVAMENASNKHIYFYQNPTLEYTKEDWTNTIPWTDFYSEYMIENLEDNTLIERYEKQCTTLDELRDALVKDRESFLSNPFRATPCHKIEYDRTIPSSQANRRRGNLDCYFIRPEVDDKLKEEFDKIENRTIIVTGQSTSGKTIAVCRMLRKLPHDYSVVIINADTTKEQLNRLSVSQFQHGKIILLLDDLQFIFWEERNEEAVPIDRELNRKLSEILRVNNPYFKVIATTSYDFKEMKTLLTFDGVAPPAIADEVAIKPLSLKKINEYARELRTYGYLKLRPEAGMTIGSLFFDIDRIKTKYNNLFQKSNLSNLQKSMLQQLCHGIKCLWMWKRRSRNKIDLLLDFLQFTYKNSYEKADRSTLCELAGKLDDLIYYQDIEKDTFEVEDIIVTQVFQYYSSEASDTMLEKEKKALKGIFRYIYYKDKQNFFRNTTKILHRVKNSSANAPALQQYIINDIVARIFKDEQTLYTSTEMGTNPEGISADWVDAYIGNVANFAPTNAEAIRIWKLARKYNRNELNTLRWLLPRLHDQADKDMVHKDLLNEQGQMKDKYIENSYIEFQIELLRFLDIEEAKEIYLKSSFIRGILPVAPAVDDIDDFFSDDSAEDKNVQDTNNGSYLIGLKEKRIRNFSRQMMQKSRTLDDIHSIKKFLQENDKGVVPHDDATFYFNFIAAHTWLEVFRRFTHREELLAFFNELIQLSVDKKEDVSMFLNKTEVLNGILENIPSTYAYDVWNQMGSNCDGYSLNFMLQKSKNFEQAKGIFNTFMTRLEQQGEDKTELKVGEIYLNDLLDTTSTYSGIKECEALFHKYHLLEPDQSLLDYPSQHTQGILYQRMSQDDIKAHMKKHRPNKGDEPRNIRTIVHFILKAGNYEEAYQYLFGDTPDCITPEEQSILKHSPYVVSEMFSKVKTPEEGVIARDFFENRLDKSLLDHPDANVLNIIINNRFIYPYYEQKVDMIKRMSEVYTVQKNSFTHKHLLYHLTNHTQNPIPPEQVQQIINEQIMDSLDAPKDILRQMLIQRYYAGRPQDYKLQPFPIFTPKGWEIRETTILEYVYCLLDVGVCDGGIVFSSIRALLRQDDLEGAQKLQEKAIQRNVLIDYKSYCNLKTMGAVIPKPYLLVEHYPIIKDVCYQMRERGMTFDEAEKRIKEMEKDMHISIARTQIYWNNVVSRMANNRMNKNRAYQDILRFIEDHNVPMSSEIYYSLLHTITSIEDYENIKKLYKGELNVGHILTLLKKIPELAKFRIPEWAFVTCLRQEFDEWYDILSSIGEKDYDKRNKISYQSQRYQQLQVITPKGYLNQTFLFWWTISYAVSVTEEQRKNELDTLITMIPKPFISRYPEMIERYFVPYPQELLDTIKSHIDHFTSSVQQ